MSEQAFAKQTILLIKDWAAFQLALRTCLYGGPFGADLVSSTNNAEH